MRRKWGEKESYEHCWGFEAIAFEVSRSGSSGCLFYCKNACGVATLPAGRARERRTCKRKPRACGSDPIPVAQRMGPAVLKQGNARWGGSFNGQVSSARVVYHQSTLDGFRRGGKERGVQRTLRRDEPAAGSRHELSDRREFRESAYVQAVSYTHLTLPTKRI